MSCLSNQIETFCFWRVGETSILYQKMLPEAGTTPGAHTASGLGRQQPSLRVTEETEQQDTKDPTLWIAESVGSLFPIRVIPRVAKDRSAKLGGNLNV